MAAHTTPAHSHWSGVEPGESFVLELEFDEKYAKRVVKVKMRRHEPSHSVIKQSHSVMAVQA